MSTIDWSKWESAKRAAEWGLRRTGASMDGPDYEDLVEDIALSILTDGWNAQWRVADVYRRYYGRPERWKGPGYSTDQMMWEMGAEQPPRQDVLLSVLERTAGRPLNPCTDPRPYRIAASPEDFARRWL
jgi:hypothetical protein